MFRRGIVRLSDVSVGALRNSRKRPAYTLLGDLDGGTEEQEHALDLLYGYGRLDGGVAWKTTWPHRFDALDDRLSQEIASRFPADRWVRVHDMGASNAITSVELFRRLAADRNNIRLRASDLFDRVRVVSLPRSGWRVVFDVLDKPIQFVGRRLVLSADHEPRNLPINRLIGSYVRRTVLPKAEFRLAMGEAEAITLFHPRATALAVAEHRFELAADDIFRPEPGAYEVVRVMSLLIPSRFRPPAIREALAAIAGTIVEGGLFVLGQNEGEAEGTIFVKRAGRFSTVADVGAPYRYKAEVLALSESSRVDESAA